MYSLKVGWGWEFEYFHKFITMELSELVTHGTYISEITLQFH